MKVLNTNPFELRDSIMRLKAQVMSWRACPPDAFMAHAIAWLFGPTPKEDTRIFAALDEVADKKGERS